MYKFGFKFTHVDWFQVRMLNASDSRSGSYWWYMVWKASWTMPKRLQMFLKGAVETFSSNSPHGALFCPSRACICWLNLISQQELELHTQRYHIFCLFCFFQYVAWQSIHLHLCDAAINMIKLSVLFSSPWCKLHSHGKFHGLFQTSTIFNKDPM